MPNLQDVASNPDALRQSVERMMDRRGERPAVRLNHGIKNAEELEAWVRQAPEVGNEDVAAYHRLLGLDAAPHD